MGKSTLLAYLALLTARCCLDRSVSSIEKTVRRGKNALLTIRGHFHSLFEIFQDPFSDSRAVPKIEKFFEPPPLIPVLMRLGDYAAERSRSLDIALSLSDYLKLKLDPFRLPVLASWMENCLLTGRCLLLLDGLDEISDPHLRRQVREAVATFVLDYGDTSGTHFNLFLITSRVAGYDQAAFPDYPHFTIAELTADRKSTRLNSSHQIISYAVFCLKKKTTRDRVLLKLRIPV